MPENDRSGDLNDKLIAALEGIREDLAGINMPMQDYARVANKITLVVGAARDTLAGGPGYLIDYRKDEP